MQVKMPNELSSQHGWLIADLERHGFAADRYVTLGNRPKRIYDGTSSVLSHHSFLISLRESFKFDGFHK